MRMVVAANMSHKDFDAGWRNHVHPRRLNPHHERGRVHVMLVQVYVENAC